MPILKKQTKRSTPAGLANVLFFMWSVGFSQLVAHCFTNFSAFNCLPAERIFRK